MYVPDSAVYILAASVVFTIFCWLWLFPKMAFKIFWRFAKVYSKEELDKMSPRQKAKVRKEAALMFNLFSKAILLLLNDPEFKKKVLKPILKQMAIEIAGEFGYTRTVKDKNGKETKVLDTGKGISGKMGQILHAARQFAGIYKELKQP